jgi:hypothetical protein
MAERLASRLYCKERRNNAIGTAESSDSTGNGTRDQMSDRSWMS